MPRHEVVTTPIEPLSPTEKIIRRLAEQDIRFFHLGNILIKCRVGMDPQKELSTSGWSCFILPDQTFPSEVKFFDYAGDLLDLSRLSEPIPITKIASVEITGQHYLLRRDPWGNPLLLPKQESSTTPTVPEFREALTKSIAIWEAATQGTTAVENTVRQVLGEEVRETLAGVLDILEEYPALADYHEFSELMDLWDIAYQASGFKDAVNRLKFGLDGSIELPERLQNDDAILEALLILRQILLHLPLNARDRYFIAALPLTRIAVQNSLQTYRYWFINQFSRPYAMANLAENLICRQAVGEAAYSHHQQQFAAFRDWATQQDIQLPDWFTAYEGNEFVWRFSLDGTLAEANQLVYFLNKSLSDHQLGRVLTHERIHTLTYHANYLGKDIRWQNRDIQNWRFVNQEKYKETYTETLAILIKHCGDLAAAIQENEQFPLGYFTGVRQLLKILDRIETQTGQKFLGTKLMIQGLTDLPLGQTQQTTQPVEIFYDQQIAKIDGAFRTGLARYADKHLIDHTWTAESSPVELGRFKKVVHKAFTNFNWRRLTAAQKEYYDNSEAQLLGGQLEETEIAAEPLTIMNIQSSPRVQSALTAVIRDQQARRQFEEYLRQKYRAYCKGLKGLLEG